ncbi:MAG TPA: ABC transporter permease [Tissierellaceae bacterium]|nr:ABC transporter permease [Tissierellaceae bacterium]
MKDFLTVLKFELAGFMKKKAFIISTGIICVILVVVLLIPNIIDIFSSDSKDDELPTEDDQIVMDGEYGYIDETKDSIDIEALKDNFHGGSLIEETDIDSLEEKVNSKEFEAGFILKSPTEYEYIVINNEMIDSTNMLFEEAVTEAYRIKRLEELGIEYNEVGDLIHPNVESDTKVLGKDSAGNYMYTYVLVFGLYFIIILYGQLIATSVASEKSNRAMEVLVTSTKTTNLIFGKVVAGALAGIIQFGLVILTGVITYNLNAAAWDNSLDFIFKIPVNVLLIFSIFGILGYLFYAFIFGALGALVSRVEDVSSSATPITIIFIIVFMVAITGMQDTEGIVLKVASFIPFSSFMAMFVRVSMGSVTVLETIISLVILVISTGLIGLLASKIYRMGTLMYGNPVKLRKVMKILKDD